MNMGLCMAIYSVFSRENTKAVIEYFSEIERRLSALETWQENHSNGFSSSPDPDGGK